MPSTSPAQATLARPSLMSFAMSYTLLLRCTLLMSHLSMLSSYLLSPFWCNKNPRYHMKYAISGTIIIITVVPPTFFLKIYFKSTSNIVSETHSTITWSTDCIKATQSRCSVYSPQGNSHHSSDDPIIFILQGFPLCRLGYTYCSLLRVILII